MKDLTILGKRKYPNYKTSSLKDIKSTEAPITNQIGWRTIFDESAMEDLHPNVSSKIVNDKVYHSSPKKLDILSGKRSMTDNAHGSIFVSPYKHFSCIFVIDCQDIVDEIEKQIGKKHIQIDNFDYLEWRETPKYTTTMPSTVHVLVRTPEEFKSFKGTATGYIYTIDFSKYKDKAKMWSKQADSDCEFIISGDVEYEKCEKITLKYVVLKEQKEHLDPGFQANEALSTKEYTESDLKQFYKHCSYDLIDFKENKPCQETHKNTKTCVGDLTILGRRKQPSYKTSFDYFTNRSIDKELEDIRREHAALLKEYTNLTAIITAVTQYPDDPGLEAFIIEAGLEEIKLYDKLKQFVVRAEAFVKRIFGFIKQFGSARVSAAVTLIDEWIKVLEEYSDHTNMNELKLKNNGKIPKVNGFISVYEKIIAFAEFNRDNEQGIFKKMEKAKNKKDLSTDDVVSEQYKKSKKDYMTARDAVSAYINGKSATIGNVMLEIEKPDVGGWFEVLDMKTLRDKVEATRSVMDLLVKQERLCLEFVKELGKNAEATRIEDTKPKNKRQPKTAGSTPSPDATANNNAPDNGSGPTIPEQRKALRDVWDDLSKNVLHGITDTIIKCSTKIGKIVTEFKSGFSTGLGQ